MIERGQPKRLSLQLLYADGSPNTTDTPVCQVSLDGGAFAACVNAPARIGATECWSLLLTAAEMDADAVLFRATAEGSNPYTLTLYPEAAYTPARAARLDNADVATSTRLAGDAYTAPDNASASAAAATAASVAARLTAERAACLDAPVSGVPAAVWQVAQRTLTGLGLSGLGANPVTVAVQDATGKPTSGIGITVWNAAQSAALAIGVTDQAGQVVFNLSTGLIYLAVVSNLAYEPIAPIDYTVVAGAQSVPTITLTSRVIDPAADPALCTVYGTLITGDGKPVVGQTAHAELRDGVPAASGNLLSKASVVSEPSVANGLFTLYLPRGKKYRVVWDSDRQSKDITVADAAQMDLGALFAQ